MTESFLKVALMFRVVGNVVGPLRDAVRAIEAVDRAAEKTKNLARMGAQMQSFGRQALVASAVAGAALLVPIKAYGDLEDAQTRARMAFLTSAGTDRYFADVEKVATRLGAQLPGSTADFLQMAAAMKETGVSAATIANGALEATGYMRVLIGDLDPAEAGRMMATFSNSLGIAESDFVRFVDLMQRAKYAKGLDMTEFAYAAKYIGPIAQQVGLAGLEGSRGLIALAASASQAGIRGEQFGTGMREALTSIAQLSIKMKRGGVREILQGAGIQLEFFRNGRFAGLENMVAQLSKLNALADKDRLLVLSRLFGDSAAPMLAAISKGGVAGYREVLEQMEHQAPLMDRISAVLGIQKNQWEAFTGTLFNLAAAIGESVAPAVKWLFGALNTLADTLTKFVQHHQKLVAVLMAAVAAFALVSFIVGVAVLALGTYVVWMIAARNAGFMFQAAMALTRVSIASLISPISGAVRALWGLAGSLLWSSGVTPAFRAAQLAGTGFRGFLAGMTPAVMRAIAPLQTLAGWLLWKTGVGPAFEAAKIAGTGFSGFMWGFAPSIMRAVAALRAAAVASWAFTASLLANPMTWIVAGVLAAVALLAYGIYRFWGPLSRFVKQLWADIKSVASIVPKWAMPGSSLALAGAALAMTMPATAAAVAATPISRSVANQATLSRAAVDRRPTSAAGDMHFNYSPTIHLPAGSPAETEAAARAALADDHERLRAYIEHVVDQKNDQDARTSYTRGPR